MTLFELAASLGFDISEFETNANTAEDRAKALEGALGGLSFPDLTSGNLADLDAAIAELDEEIKALDEEIEALELDLEIDTLDQQNDKLEREISNSERRTSAFAGIIEGVVNAAAEFVGDLMNEAFDFVAEGFENAANSGSELAGRYQDQMMGLSSTAGLVQDKIGTTLLALTVDGLNLYETIDDVLSKIFNITEQDKLNASLKRLSDYEFSNLEQARQALDGMFSIGDKIDLSPVEFSFEDALESYERQQLYWNEYNQTLSALRERGVSDDILMQYTSGSTSDYMMLQWYSSLTDEQLAELDAAREQVEQAEASAAETISELELANDETYQEMRERHGQAEEDALQWRREQENGGGGRRFTTDEAVMAVSASVSELQTSIDALPAAISSAISGAQVTMDGQTVGTIVFPYISSEFHRVMIGRKYTPTP